MLDVLCLDVLSDMGDPELPLKVKERGEWGEPLASKVRNQGGIMPWGEGRGWVDTACGAGRHGAATNMQPDVAEAALLHVPFWMFWVTWAILNCR